MVRRLLALIGLFVILPVCAGELEDAVQSGKTTVLYVSAPWCGACRAFNPNYNKLLAQFGNKYKFVKVNADTKYGNELSNKYRIHYIPYVRVFKQGRSTPIGYNCMTSYSCLSKTVADF